jgi:hypothetical protein
MHIEDRLRTEERGEQKRVTASPARPLVQWSDVVAIVIVLIGVVWGVVQRRHVPAVPLWTLDTSGYLYPALSWLRGEGFQQTNGRDWLYPAILFVTIKSGEDFSWIVRLQQFLNLLAAPLLWFGVRLWLSIYPWRSALCHGAGVLLGAMAACVYVLGTTQILHEATIGPEGVLSFFIVVTLISALSYFRTRWVTHRPGLATVFGAGVSLLCYADILLKPSWSLAFVPTCCLLIAGMFGSGQRILRFAPAGVALILLGGAWSLPHILQFKPDSSSRRFLPLTLVSIHACEIVENAERHHLLDRNASQSDNRETRFYQALAQAYKESREQPFSLQTLGFDADYIMYRRNVFTMFQSEERLTDGELIKLCYEVYFGVWKESPGLMIAKIAKQFRLFLNSPRQDFAAYTLSRRCFFDQAGSRPSIEDLVREAKSKGYINQRFYASYLGDLEKVYAEGLQIPRVNVQQRYVALLFARMCFWIQVTFFAGLLCALVGRPFLDLRFSGLAAAVVAAVLYGNVLTISVVHTLDLDRYRTGYAPALLLTLVIMAVFVTGFCERLFQMLSSCFVRD